MAELFSTVLPKEGFHRTFSTKVLLHDPNILSNPDCSLHLYFILLPITFVDPYELAHHALFYTFRHWGTSNLELPVSVVSQSGSSLLLEVKTPGNLPEVEVKLPLHLRYGDITKGSSSGYHTVEMPLPTGFIACTNFTSRGTPIPSNLPTEISSLFNTSTTFIPISYVGKNTSEILRVPIGNPADLLYVEAGTVFTILLSFCFLLRISWLTSRRVNCALQTKLD